MMQIIVASRPCLYSAPKALYWYFKPVSEACQISNVNYLKLCCPQRLYLGYKWSWLCSFLENLKDHHGIMIFVIIWLRQTRYIILSFFNVFVDMIQYSTVYFWQAKLFFITPYNLLRFANFWYFILWNLNLVSPAKFLLWR